MSTESQGSLLRIRFPALLRKILVAAFSGTLIYLLTKAFPDTPSIWEVTISVFTSGVILVVQYFVELDERLVLLEQKASDHYRNTQSLLETGFSKITSTIELFGIVEGSALPTEVVTEFVRHAIEIHPDPLPLVYRFAQAEIARVSQLLKELGKGGEVVYDGEDHYWLLALAGSVRSTIRATSLASVDNAGFWMSDLGQLYLELQAEASRRSVKIQRIFILDRAELAQDPDFGRICQWQVDHNIDVRMLDPKEIPNPWKLDFILFDESISYETTPVVQFTTVTRPSITSTKLVLDQTKVRTRINRFNELWDLATPYPD